MIKLFHATKCLSLERLKNIHMYRRICQQHTVWLTYTQICSQINGCPLLSVLCNPYFLQSQVTSVLTSITDVCLGGETINSLGPQQGSQQSAVSQLPIKWFQIQIQIHYCVSHLYGSYNTGVIAIVIHTYIRLLDCLVSLPGVTMGKFADCLT